MRKLIIRSGTGRPVRANPEILPPESRPQTVIVHHYHHAQHQQTSGGGSFILSVLIAILIPFIGVIVGAIQLGNDERRGQGLFTIFMSCVFFSLYYYILTNQGYMVHWF